MALRFEWNQRKAQSNFQKHGVPFSEATTVFADPLSITIPDPITQVQRRDFYTSASHIPGGFSCIVHRAGRANSHDQRSTGYSGRTKAL